MKIFRSKRIHAVLSILFAVLLIAACSTGTPMEDDGFDDDSTPLEEDDSSSDESDEISDESDDESDDESTPIEENDYDSLLSDGSWTDLGLVIDPDEVIFRGAPIEGGGAGGMGISFLSSCNVEPAPDGSPLAAYAMTGSSGEITGMRPHAYRWDKTSGEWETSTSPEDLIGDFRMAVGNTGSIWTISSLAQDFTGMVYNCPENGDCTSYECIDTNYDTWLWDIGINSTANPVAVYTTIGDNPEDGWSVNSMVLSGTWGDHRTYTSDYELKHSQIIQDGPNMRGTFAMAIASVYTYAAFVELIPADGEEPAREELKVIRLKARDESASWEDFGNSDAFTACTSPGYISMDIDEEGRPWILVIDEATGEIHVYYLGPAQTWTSVAEPVSDTSTHPWYFYGYVDDMTGTDIKLIGTTPVISYVKIVDETEHIHGVRVAAYDTGAGAWYYLGPEEDFVVTVDEEANTGKPDLAVAWEEGMPAKLYAAFSDGGVMKVMMFSEGE